MNQTLKKILIKTKKQVFSEIIGNNITNRKGEGYDFCELKEYEIAKKVTMNSFEEIKKIINKFDLEELKKEITNIHMDEELERYIIDIIDASRNPKNYDLEEFVDIIHFGASPRATIDMFKAVKANAYLRGNDYVSPIDISMIAKDVLRHRIILTYEAMAQEINVDDVIQKILEKIAIP